jgi:hypothetical protein
MMDNVITSASTSDDYIKIHDKLPLISKELRRTAFDVCGIEYNESIKSVNGGHLLFNKNIDFNEYIAKVKTYLMSDAVTTALTNQKNWVDFFIDEIFFSCLFHQYNKQNGGAYNLNGFVNFKMFSLSNGKLKNIYATINDYAVTHFAGMQDVIVYKRLKELNYVR